MTESAERQKIDFLSDLVTKTERREFNCTLCHTLMRMFALSKSSQLKESETLLQFLSLVQEEIYKVLTLICSHAFEPVDHTHLLKVIFLVFLKTMPIMPVREQLPNGSD